MLYIDRHFESVLNPFIALLINIFDRNRRYRYRLLSNWQRIHIFFFTLNFAIAYNQQALKRCKTATYIDESDVLFIIYLCLSRHE